MPLIADYLYERVIDMKRSPSANPVVALSVIIGMVLCAGAAKAEPPVASSSAALETPAERPNTAATVGWVVTGFGVGALSGGIAMELVMQHRRSVASADPSATRSQWEATQQYVVPGAILCLAGLGAIATGVTVTIISSRARQTAEALRVSVGFGSVAVGGAF